MLKKWYATGCDISKLELVSVTFNLEDVELEDNTRVEILDEKNEQIEKRERVPNVFTTEYKLLETVGKTKKKFNITFHKRIIHFVEQVFLLLIMAGIKYMSYAILLWRIVSPWTHPPNVCFC